MQLKVSGIAQLSSEMTPCPTISRMRPSFGCSKELLANPLDRTKTNTTIPVDSGSNGEPTYHISLVRGVVMNLDLSMRLVSITVTPRKVRERRKLMRIVGIGRDPASDVSAKHDEYLAEQTPTVSLATRGATIVPH